MIVRQDSFVAWRGARTRVAGRRLLHPKLHLVRITVTDRRSKG